MTIENPRAGEPGPTGRGPVVSVMLIVPDASEAIAWYASALGAREVWNLGGVAGLAIGDARFFIHEVNPRNPSENSPEEIGRTSTRIELFVDNPDDVLARLIGWREHSDRGWRTTLSPGARTARVHSEIRSATPGPWATAPPSPFNSAESMPFEITCAKVRAPVVLKTDSDRLEYCV